MHFPVRLRVSCMFADAEEAQCTKESMTPKRTFILHTPSMHSASQQFIYLKLLSILAINLKSVIKLQQIQNKIRLKKPEKQTKINKKNKNKLDILRV